MAATSPVVDNNPGFFTYTIPATGAYTITADGAQGGSVFPTTATQTGEPGGAGANLGITVTLTAGTVLDIVVGTQGATGTVNNIGGGGGGGSFVAEEVPGQTDIPLIVAGGGGGGADGSGNLNPGLPADINQPGVASSSFSPGGTNGNGGGVNTLGLPGGGGGGGFYTNGGTVFPDGNGGLSFLAYVTDFLNHTPVPGGAYGGGGQASAQFGGEGGGGGGYSGGGGGGAGTGNVGGGGGGSFFTSLAQTVQINAPAHIGNGLVEIAPVVACFAAGTRIATPDGEVAVERLAVGDAVLTRGGGTQPVTWIGHRTLDCRRHPRPEQVWPVRVAADAFGPGLPSRPLFLSPDHALFIDGVLIPVKYLVDGHAITRCPVEQVTYYHVELPRHDLLLAEGLAAESYLDDGARGRFAEAGGVVALHPDFAPRAREASGCAPLVVTGPAVAAARARLAGGARRAA